MVGLVHKRAWSNEGILYTKKVTRRRSLGTAWKLSFQSLDANSSLLDVLSLLMPDSILEALFYPDEWKKLSDSFASCRYGLSFSEVVRVSPNASIDRTERGEPKDQQGATAGRDF